MRGELSPVQYDLLGFLYGSADFNALADRRETPRLTLARIAEGIAWQHTDGALAKLIRRTRDEGWFDHRTERGKGKRGGVVVYVFRLHPEGPSSSAVSEAAIPLVERDSAVPEPEAVRGFEKPVRRSSAVSRSSSSAVSDGANPLPERDSAEAGPEPVRGSEVGREGPVSELTLDRSAISEGARPLPEPDSASSAGEPVRAAQNNREELLLEEALPNNVSLGVEVSEEGETVEDLVESTDHFLAVAREVGSNPNPVASAIEQAQRASERNGGRSPVRVEVAGAGLEWSEPPVEGEAGVLADAQALVDAGLAQWVDEEATPA